MTFSGFRASDITNLDATAIGDRIKVSIEIYHIPNTSVVGGHAKPGP